MQALPPIALGHAIAILAAVLVVGAAQLVVSLNLLRYVCASVLILFGLYKLIRRKHPRWVGMRVGFRDLTAWSFFMSSAHGAGLMLIPVLLRLSEPMQGAHDHGDHAANVGSATVLADLVAVGLHTLTMFAVMGAIAIVVYEKLGVMNSQAHLVQR